MKIFSERTDWLEIEGQLENLGWPQIELARRLGIGPHAVMKWKRQGSVPMYAASYLGVVLLLKDIQDSTRDEVRVRR